jgi:hypothetical protein
VIGADTTEEENHGDKGPVTEHRKGLAGLEEKDPTGRPHGRIEETAPLRKALGEKKEQTDRSGEEKAEASEAGKAVQFRAEDSKVVVILYLA